MLGIYEISMKRISYETGISEAHIKEYFTEFETLSKAFVWFGRVYLPNWMKNQSMNVNMYKCAEALFDRLPKELIDKLKEQNIESFESLSKGWVILPKIEREIES